METNQLLLLKSRRFLPLFLTQFFGAFNENLIKSTLVILISYSFSKKTGVNSQIYFAAGIALYMLPLFLFSTLSGQLADKYEKSKLISIVKLAEIGLACLVATEFYLQNEFLFVLIFFFLGMEVTMLLPLKYSVLPELIEKKELLGGNGLMIAGTCFAIMISMFGGVIILLQNGPAIVSFIIISFSILGWLASRFIFYIKPDNPKLIIDINFIKTIFVLVKYTASHKIIFFCILSISLFMFVLNALIIEIPYFAKNVLHADEVVTTFCFFILAVGVSVGALLCNKIYKGKLRLTYCSWGLVGMMLFLGDIYFSNLHTISLSNELLNLKRFFYKEWRVFFDILLFGISSGIYIIPFFAVIQHKSVPEHRARIQACNSIINSFFAVLGSIFCLFMLYLKFEIIQIFLILALLLGSAAIFLMLFEYAS